MELPPNLGDERGQPAALDKRLDDLVLQLLRVDDFHLRPTAEEAQSLIRDVLGFSTGADQGLLEGADARPVRFEPGSIVDGVWRVHALLGDASSQGGCIATAANDCC